VTKTGGEQYFKEVTAKLSRLFISLAETGEDDLYI